MTMRLGRFYFVVASVVLAAQCAAQNTNIDAADQAAAVPNEFEVSLHVWPAAEPKPALKYKLRVEDYRLRDGDVMQGVIRATLASKRMPDSVPIRLRDELVHLWPEAISIGSATASPSQLVADIVDVRGNLSADENGVGEVYLTCTDDLAADRTMAQVEALLEQITDDIEGVAVPKETVRRAGKTITLSWSNVEIGSFVFALLNAM